MIRAQTGDAIPDLVIASVERADVETYAEASRDQNPLHLDDPYAKALGLPGPLVHGTYVMGLMERLLRNWSRDISIRRLETQFVRPMAHGTSLRFSGRIAQVDLDRLTIRIVVRERQDSICCIGSAECVLPSAP